MTEEKVQHQRAWEQVGGSVRSLRSYLLDLAEKGNTFRSEETEETILKRRAELLARKPDEAGGASDIEVLQFQLAYERYAMETSFIKEVIQLREVVPIPQAPAFLLGIMNLRGEPMSVLDIRKFFNLPGTPISDLNRVIILKDGKMSFGVLVDRIHDIVTLPESAVFRDKILAGDLPRNYIAGLTSSRLILLDAKALLNDKSIIIKQMH